MRRFATLVITAVVLASCGSVSDSATSTGGPSVSAVTTSTTLSKTTAASTSAAVGTTTTTREASSPTAGDATTTSAAETTTTTQVDSDQELPLIEGLRTRLSAQIWKMAEIAEEIRGLEFDGLPAITVLSPEEFADRVRAEVESELEDIEVDEALFKLLGLLEPDDDLAALYGELYGESVAGFYSSEDRELVIPASGEEFTALETITLIHELVHALTDQHFEFGPRMEHLVDNQLYDPAGGMVSLVEGDATLSEVLYVENLSVSERNRLMTELANFEPPDVEIPLFMERALYFPYERGFEYVLNRWRAGGMQAVNDLYLDPPASTEEIYEGAASPATQPIEMERPAGELPEGYEEIYDYTWGFLDILLMFEQILGPQPAVDAATGWGGGRSLVGFAEDGEVVFVWEYAGDSAGEAEELAGLLYDYAVEGMDVGDSLSRGGESGFVGSGEDYVFVSLTAEGLVMVACSDPQVCPSVTDAYLFS